MSQELTILTELCNIHVAHIVSGDLWAGAEVQLHTLAKTQHSMPGMRVTAIVLNHGRLEQELKNNGIEVIVLDESKLNGIRILLRLIRTVRKLKPDIIHTHRNKENILGSIAAFMNGNIPSLRTAHGAPEHQASWYQLPKKIILFMDWFCGRYSQKSIIAVSEDLAEVLAKSYPAKKIYIIENGIDIKSLTHTTKHIEKNNNTDHKVFRIGFAGRLVPIKRVDLFIQSAHQLLEKHPELNTSFHIFGDGPLHAELKTLNEQFHTRHIMHFEGHSENMTGELQKLDALLITSDHEGLPMILLEAMALQVPIIAHAVGGIPNLLDEGNCGLLVRQHNPSAYADAIYKLVIDSGLYIKNTKNALERVNATYSAELNADTYCNEYKRLLSG